MKKYLFVAGWIAFILYLLYTATHGLFLPDEGYILNSGTRILHGQIPYRDFDLVYTPLTPLFSSLAFVIFGQSILGERLLTFLISTLTAISLYKLSYSQLKNRWLSMLIVAIYASWGPGHLNFLNPAMIAIDLGIITSFAWMQKTKRFYYITGALITLTFLAKQNFGAALLVGIIISVFFQRKYLGKDALRNIVLGCLATCGIILTLLLATSSLAPFLAGLYTYTLKLFIEQGTLNTSIDIGSGITAPLKILLYLSPLILSLVTLAKTRRALMFFLPMSVLLFYLAGIRPETDYIHLAPLLAISSLSLIPLLIAKGHGYKIGIIICVLLAMTGIYTSLNFPYYRWKPQLVTQKTFVGSQRAMIWTDETTARDLSTLKEFVDENVTRKEKLYLNYYAPMVYFYLDRPNPTRFDYPGLPVDLERQLLSSLEAQKVDYILTHPLAGVGTGMTKEFITKNYVLKKKLYGYEVWGRRINH